MKQIIDDKGNKLKNHFRVGDSIIVNDKEAMANYNRQLENVKKIKSLESEVEILKQLVQKVLDDKGSSESR